VRTPQVVVRVSIEGFDETELAVAGLVARVRAAVTEGSTLAVMEAGIRQEMLAVARAAAQDGLNAVSAAEVRRHDVTGQEGTTRPWATTGRARTIASLFGPVTFSRIAYRGPGVPDVFPADEQLDLPVGSIFSRAVEARVGYLSAKTAYRQVADLILWETGTTIGTRQLRQIAARAGADAATFAHARAVPQTPQTPQVSGVPAGAVPGSAERTRPARALVATFDGKGVVMRPEARRTAPGQGKPATTRGGAGLPGHGEQHARRGRKRLAELSCLYDVSLAPRTPEQVLASLTNTPATSSDSNQPATPAPRATNRWLQADLTATIDQVVAGTYTQVDRRDPHHQQDWVALVDGAWPQINAILAQAAARGIHIPILIDLMHVLGYLWDAANVTFNPGAPAAAAWVATQTRALLEGHPATVIAEIRDRATRFRCTGTAKDKILAAATYLDNHRDLPVLPFPRNGLVWWFWGVLDTAGLPLDTGRFCDRAGRVKGRAAIAERRPRRGRP
jgi:hypothetical protein